jgi:hypothetical protein
LLQGLQFRRQHAAEQFADFEHNHRRSVTNQPFS